MKCLILFLMLVSAPAFADYDTGTSDPDSTSPETELNTEDNTSSCVNCEPVAEPEELPDTGTFAE